MATRGLKAGATLRGATYRIEKVLGQGSFGITYLATAKFTTQGNLGRMDVEAKVAIKEFFMSEVNGRSEDGSTVEGSSGSVFSNYRKKFRKEAENLARLEHPNIVKVFDVFDENHTTYYVMEFLEGQNLDDYIKQCGYIRETEAIHIISEIGEALSYMHSKRMLHLDIKPKNIMRKSNGKYYLIDFGLSKQFTDDGEPESSTSIGLGTPGYAPIEQAGYKQDGSFPATLDVYALGATMFKMLTGVRPPEATYILNEGFPAYELKAKGVSDNTRSGVEKAMAPIKRERFQTVKLFINFANERTLIIPAHYPTQHSNLKPTIYRASDSSPKADRTPVLPPEPARYPNQDHYHYPKSQQNPEIPPQKLSPNHNPNHYSNHHSSNEWWILVAGTFILFVIGLLIWTNTLDSQSDTTDNMEVVSEEETVVEEEPAGPGEEVPFMEEYSTW